MYKNFMKNKALSPLTYKMKLLNGKIRWFKIKS